jgi:toxin ParE1/3/4
MQPVISMSFMTLLLSTMRLKNLGQIERAFPRLSKFPERGAHPKELLALGILEYREIFFKPYRIIYRVVDKNVYVLLIADGRRDMQTLLQRRLLDA